MTLITFQDGKPVMRDGKVGTEQECCCGDGDGCPPGCPSLAGCNMIVTLLYQDPLNLDYGAAADYYNNLTCQLSFEVADIPFESGGDIGALFTVAYDENCDPVATLVSITHSEDCNNPNVDCVGVSVSFDCNPLP